MNSDTVRFLLKVLVVSAGLSILIKVIGPSLSVQNLEGRSLNQLAIVLVTLPSIIVGTVLLFKRQS